MSRIRTIKPEFWTDEKPVARWIYCLTETGEEGSGPCKVGIASNLEKRLSSLQGGNRRLLSLAWRISLSDPLLARHAEQYCLSLFRPSIYIDSGQVRLQSEWIDAAPSAALKAVVGLLNADDDKFVRRLP